jgi:serine/threonine protein kinase
MGKRVGDGEAREPLTEVIAVRPGEAERRDGVPEGERFVGRGGRPDEYKLVARVARGGEGFVWRAEYQGSLPRSVDFAIKQFVAPPGIAQAEWPPPELIDRWFEQLRLLQLVRDDHVVGYREIFVGWPPHPAAGDTGTYFAEAPAELRTWYLVMEWVDGPTLHQLVSDGQLSLPARVEVIGEIAAAIDLLHSGASTQGMSLLHRDIKPGNIIVNSGRGAVLVDFGLLRVEEPVMTELPMWTGPYLAPEVHANKARSSRASDSWSLAATAFFALTGQHPSPMDCGVMRDQLRTSLENRIAAPDRVIDVLMSVLDQPPDARPTARDWTRQLRDVIGAPPSSRPTPRVRPRRRRSLWSAAAALIALVGLGSYLLVTQLVSDSSHSSISASTAAAGEFTVPVNRTFSGTHTTTDQGDEFRGTYSDGSSFSAFSQVGGPIPPCGSGAAATRVSVNVSAPNGDTMNQSQSGSTCQSGSDPLNAFEFSGTYTITGGTGCFTDATGGGQVNAHVTFDSPAGGSSTGVITGTITEKKRPHCPAPRS